MLTAHLQLNMITGSNKEKSIPIHFEFGLHGGKWPYPGLEGLRDFLVQQLEQSPTGKVLILKEFANHTKEDGQRIEEEIAKGTLPSDAMKDIFTAYMKKRLSPQEYDKLQPTDFTDGFHKRYYEIVDELYTAYPGRIALLSEWAPQEEIILDPKKNPTNKLRRAVFHRRDKSEQYAAFRDYLLYMSTSAIRRENRLSATLKQRLHEDQDIIAVGSFFGSGHTGLYIDLKKDGYNTTRAFSDKKQGKYIYGNPSELVRYMRFFPDRIIPEDYLQNACEMFVQQINPQKDHSQ